jgi:hypothetical protein
MPEAILPFDSDTDSYECMKNIGYVAVSSVFHTLGIDTFFDRQRTYLDISYNLTSVVKLLVYELGYKFSGGKIITSLRKANVAELQQHGIQDPLL